MCLQRISHGWVVCKTLKMLQNFSRMSIIIHTYIILIVSSQNSNGSIDVEAFISEEEIERACDKDKHYIYTRIYD